MSILTWSSKKPELIERCLLLVASKREDDWHYKLLQVKEIDSKWYLYNEWGNEWGDYSDLSADLYCMMKLLSKADNYAVF